jgi:hypothetical protein
VVRLQNQQQTPNAQRPTPNVEISMHHKRLMMGADSFAHSDSRAGSTGWRRLTLGQPCPRAGWLPDDAEAVDALPTPDPDAKGAIYSLGRSETLKKFHSHVLPLSGEKA